MSTIVRVLLAIVLAAGAAVGQDVEHEVGRLQERIRSGARHFDELFARALRVEDVSREEVDPYLEHEALGLRARAVELLDFLDTEREWNPFGGTLNELLAEEGRLRRAHLEIAEAFLRSHDEGAALDDLKFLERAGAAALRRELVKCAWRRADGASRAALTKLVLADPSDGLATRALANVGGVAGLVALGTALDGVTAEAKHRERERKDLGDALEQIRRGGRYDSLASTLDEAGRDARIHRYVDWVQRATDDQDRIDRVRSALGGILAELASRHDLPAPPKVTAGASSWRRWQKSAVKRWPADVKAGPVVFLEREQFGARLASVDDRRTAAWTREQFLDAVDELDAGFGAQREKAAVTDSLLGALAQLRLAAGPEDTAPRWVHDRWIWPYDRGRILRMVALRGHPETVDRLVQEWADGLPGDPRFPLSLRLAEWDLDAERPATSDPERLSSEGREREYERAMNAYGGALAALAPERTRTILDRMLRGATHLHHLATWAAELLTGAGTSAADWHAAVELLAKLDEAAERAAPIARLELTGTRNEVLRHLTRFASARRLEDPPSEGAATEDWRAWIDEVAPVR